MSWMTHHKLSERLASEAQVASLQGRATEARELYAQAADAEDKALADLDRSKIRTAGISAVSAASLYYKAADLVRAEEVAATWLGVGWLPDFAKAQLRSLLQSIRTDDQAPTATESAPKVERSASWVDSFLESRGLAEPDGRQLYAYRCTAKEFEALQDALQGTSAPMGAYRFRAFVLYAAQWWQRKYDGGRWAWEPLLDSIGWSMHYPDLYPDVRRAWQWWKVKPVRLPSSTRFLGTFACHGGLPLALVGNARAPITIYLKAVLGHSLEYRRFVEDTIELAKEKEHLLRPPTLRRDYVFRLAADLVDAVLEVQPSAQEKDPIAALDRDRPGWRDAMPLDLDNALARDLLLGLLRDAAQGRERRVDDFGVRRFLRLTSVGWRLGVRVQLPPSISALQLSLQLGVADDLPARMEVRVSAKGTHALGVYDYHGGDGDGEYRLAGRQAQLDLWDVEAAGELRLRFLAGDYVGDGVVPKGGASLGELPWAFRWDDYECPFIGEGTVRNRAPEIVVLMPRGEDRPPDGTREEGDVIGRPIWRVHSAVTIQTEFGACTIYPGTQEQPADDYLLRGDRWYDAYCAYPLYKGVPNLSVRKSDGPSKAVPAHEVQWRQQGGDWQQMPSKGLWQVRHVVGGELRYFRRIGILPDGMAMELEPGTVGEGCLAFTDAEALRVATDDASIDVHEGRGRLRVNMKAANPRQPPTTVKLKLHWPGSSELHVVVPFPGRGGQFLREGELVPPMVAADDLYGVRAVALSPKPNDRFWIEGELKALDLGDLGKVAHFRKPLRRVSALHELPLIDARALIELLLSASSSSDAHVDLRIVNAAGVSQCTLKVSRFAAVLQYSADSAYVELSPAPEGGGEWSFHALPMARPDEDPLTLETGGRPDSSIAALPPDLRFDEPWLAIARHDGRVCARPAEISHLPRSAAPEVRDAPPPPRLVEAMRVIAPDQRRTAVQQALQAVLDGGVDDMDEEWEFLMQMLLFTSDLPASSVDVLVGLTKTPRLLVRCLFRVDSVPRQRLWRLEHELPFSWLLVKRDVWWQESKAAFDVVREALDNAGQEDAAETARGHVGSILAEGGQSNAGLRTVGFDTALRLAGGRLTQEFADEKQLARDAARSAQIALREGLDDWPSGDGRMQWPAEIGYEKALASLWDPDQPGYRQPFFDTPVAAAFCSLVTPIEPTRRAIYFVRRMRTHDPEWFDLAYAAAWSHLAVKQDQTMSSLKGKT